MLSPVSSVVFGVKFGAEPGVESSALVLGAETSVLHRKQNFSAEHQEPQYFF